jgi:MFS family permease
MPRQWLSAGIFALQGVAVLLLIGSPSIIRLVAFVLLFGMSSGMVTLARATSVADLYGAAHYASIGGVMAFWITLARAGGPIAVPLLYTAAGRHYEPAFGLMAGVMGVAALAYASAEQSRTRRQPVSAAAGQISAADTLNLVPSAEISPWVPIGKVMFVVEIRDI